MVSLTIDAALKVLAADFTLERAHASLLVEFYRDRLLVVAKEACKATREWFVLDSGDRQLACCSRAKALR